MPDAILAAINDRGITRLLVEERELRELEVEPHTLASAQHRSMSQLAFAASGRIEGGNVRMTGTSTTARGRGDHSGRRGYRSEVAGTGDSSVFRSTTINASSATARSESTSRGFTSISEISGCWVMT